MILSEHSKNYIRSLYSQTIGSHLERKAKVIKEYYNSVGDDMDSYVWAQNDLDFYVKSTVVIYSENGIVSDMESDWKNHVASKNLNMACVTTLHDAIEKSKNGCCELILDRVWFEDFMHLINELGVSILTGYSTLDRIILISDNNSNYTMGTGITQSYMIFDFLTRNNILIYKSYDEI